MLAAAAVVFVATRPSAPSLADARVAGERKIAEAWGPPQRERLRAGFVAARERRIKLHGAEHPFVASTEANLGAMLTGLGELDEAMRVLDHARAIALKVLGDKHPLVAQIEQNRANVALRRKDFVGAEASLRVALEIDLAVRGPAQPDPIKKRELIAEALREQGKLTEARAELEHARRDLAESPPTMPAKISLDVSFARLAFAENKLDPKAFHYLGEDVDVPSDLLSCEHGIAETSGYASDRYVPEVATGDTPTEKQCGMVDFLIDGVQLGGGRFAPYTRTVGGRQASRSSTARSSRRRTSTESRWPPPSRKSPRRSGSSSPT